MKSSLQDLKKDLERLSLEQLNEINRWLQLLLKNNAKLSAENTSKNQIVKEHYEGSKTYRLQYIRCGKKKCKCLSGELHGPYWYEYRSEKGKTKSRYVGKKLDKEQKSSE